MTGQRETFDIAIVGGGLVGASMACALAPLGFRVTVLEKVPFQAPGQPSYDDRTLALNHASCSILGGLGLWPALEGAATPIREIIVTEPGRPVRVVMRASEMGIPAFGNVVEARAFGAAVLDRLGQLENVLVRCPATVTAVRAGNGAASLTVETGSGDSQVEARLVVAADGADSGVRALLGIEADVRDYGQTAVICNITPEHYHDHRAWERLTPTGPFAVLPHVGERCGLVWSVATDDAQSLLDMPEDEFLARARRRFGGDLGDFLKMGRRSSYPLRLVRAKRDSGPRTVIIGNAAHAIHPVGAQGFNLGLRDVAVLAELLAPGAGDTDPGSEELLRAYSDWRRPDQEATVSWSDGMTRLFANASPLAGVLRSAGLLAFALAPPLRRKLASGFMGYRGRTPKLALGGRLR
jgi:2-octaprenyl-6-methoxyphenol hydroxylase